MAEMKAVKDPSPDPKIGKPKPQSGVSVPYYDLTQSIIVAKTIHEQGGGSCSREQLAPLLKYSGTNNGGFLTRISAAKMFGVVSESSDSLRVSPRGRIILSPVVPADAEHAKVEAFLSIDFFAKFYERFKGTTLPQEAGLKNLLENTYEVVPKRVAPSLRVLLDSAEQAGFFKTTGDRTRMVKPILGDASTSSDAADAKKDEEGAEDDEKRDDEKKRQQRRSGGGDGGDHEIPAALLGLLEKLPRVGTPIPPKRRTALTDAFKSTINYLYPEPEDENGS